MRVRSSRNICEASSLRLCAFSIFMIAHLTISRRNTSSGTEASQVRGLRIALGQRLSGWVAANRQTISNSDASLDLGEAAAAQSPRLRSCLSTPLILDAELIGVLTVYSAQVRAFSDDHSRIIEAIAKQVSITFKSVSEFDDWIASRQFEGGYRISNSLSNSSTTDDERLFFSIGHPLFAIDDRQPIHHRRYLVRRWRHGARGSAVAATLSRRGSIDTQLLVSAVTPVDQHACRETEDALSPFLRVIPIDPCAGVSPIRRQVIAVSCQARGSRL